MHQAPRALKRDYSSGPAESLPHPAEMPDETVIASWAANSSVENDRWLRDAYQTLLEESATLAPEQRLIMYDAGDGVRSDPLGGFRKRLDARRNTKPKKPGDQKLVMTPFDPNGFNFGKIRNDKERIVKLQLKAGRYDVLTNKFPLFNKHMLLVAKALVPQQMTATHLRAIVELQQASSFCAYFNSWCASASVNHFHCHLIDEFPPVTHLPLVNGPLVMGVRCLQPRGFGGFCYVFEKTQTFPQVNAVVRAMQQDNQPHNLLLTPRYVYVFPKPLERPSRSFELYPETVGGPELIGSFTVYTESEYEGLRVEHVDELCRINTAPLPSRLLQQNPASAASCIDDTAITEPVTSKAGACASPSVSASPSSSLNSLPQLPSIHPAAYMHHEDWPQDRPIAKALQKNMSTSFV